MDYIIVGLGNPGKQYEYTRHNAGFMALDYIANKFNCDINIAKFKSLCGSFEQNGKKILLLKPQTYMNISGEAVLSAMQFYKIPADRVIIIFDDVAIPVGKIRVRKKGSHGGQNGMKSILNFAGRNDFPRIKIGTGSKPNEQWDLADWVLSKFSKEELYMFENDILERVYSAVKMMMDNKAEEAMNSYN